jgi:hypothetical protein
MGRYFSTSLLIVMFEVPALLPKHTPQNPPNPINTL